MRHACRVSQVSAPWQALLRQRFCPIKVALFKSHKCSSLERLHLQRRCHSLAPRQRSFEKILPLPVVPTGCPEPHQRCRQSQSQLVALPGLLLSCLLQRPLQGRSQIVILSLEALQPHGLLRTNEFWLRRFRQRQVVGSMSLPCDFHLSARCQSRQPILANRLEHHEAGLLTFPLRLLQQALVNERGHSLQDDYCSIAPIKRSTDNLH